MELLWQLDMISCLLSIVITVKTQHVSYSEGTVATTDACLTREVANLASVAAIQVTINYLVVAIHGQCQRYGFCTPNKTHAGTT